MSASAVGDPTHEMLETEPGIVGDVHPNRALSARVFNPAYVPSAVIAVVTANLGVTPGSCFPSVVCHQVWRRSAVDRNEMVEDVSNPVRGLDPKSRRNTGPIPVLKERTAGLSKPVERGVNGVFPRHRAVAGAG